MSMQRGSARIPRPKPKTPAERGEEFAAEQRRLKREAAERRGEVVPPEPEAAPDPSSQEAASTDEPAG